MPRVLVVASTFPANDGDPVPAFIKDQVIALKAEHPDISLSVLAPHDARSHTVSYTKHRQYDEYRFHYFWPFRLERLAGRGIVPVLRQYPLYYGLVPFLVGAEFFALLRLCRRLRPDVIYAHWFTPQGITAGLVSAITHIPFVYTSHSSDVACLRKVPLLGPFLVRYFTKKAQAVTVVSRRSLEKLQAFFDDATWQALRSKVAVIPMGVDLLANRAAAGKPSKRLRNILFIGRLAEKKGVQFLLPAFSQAREQYLDATLTIAGDGPWLGNLQRQLADLQLSDKSVVFTGYVRGDTKARLIADADIFVVPSIITPEGDAEGLPVALMEGLAAGKVCIATNESGADDILKHGESGFLVPQKDVDALSAALVQALTLKPATSREMQRAARLTAKQFVWSSIAKQHRDFLFPDVV